jgi:hypothetical protein
VVVPARASTATTRAAASPKLTQLGQVTFWECKSKMTEMLVAVNSLSMHPGQVLDITFTVRNLAAAACNYAAPYAGTAPGATAPRSVLGDDALVAQLRNHRLEQQAAGRVVVGEQDPDVTSPA